MGVSAVVVDGQIVETASQTSVSSSTSTDKDTFLQLLVAEMQYQDPLEPTSNTEFITQYATFSQVEYMQNMAATMELSRATEMVGKQVQLEVTSSTGDTTTVQGVVEYVFYQNNKAYLSIDGSLYSLDDVTMVIDSDYMDALYLAETFAAAIEELPGVDSFTLDDEDTVEAIEVLQNAYNSMTSYQQSFISSSDVTTLQAYVSKLAELQAAAEEAEESEETEEESEETVEEADE